MSEVRLRQEDEALKALVNAYGVHQWKLVASKLQETFKIKGRTGKQVRERWINHLSPELTDKTWTPSDEVQLFKLYKRFGTNWKEISRHLGHSNNSVKNHFYGAVRRNLRDCGMVCTQGEAELKKLLNDKEKRQVLLRPNYNAKKRGKPAKEGLRRSTRVKSNVRYQDVSSDEDTTGKGEGKSPPEELLLIPFVCAPQPVTVFDVTKEFLNSSQPFVMPSFKRFGLVPPGSFEFPSFSFS